MTKDKKRNSNSASQQEEVMDTSAVSAGENGTTNENDSTGPSYEDKFKFMNAMSSPVAPKKLAKKLFKCIKQATKHKNYVRLGLREAQKYIRRGEKGLVVLAGNVSPIDIYSHMPVVCGQSTVSHTRHLLFTVRPSLSRRSKHSLRVRSIERRSRQHHSRQSHLLLADGSLSCWIQRIVRWNRRQSEQTRRRRRQSGIRTASIHQRRRRNWKHCAFFFVVVTAVMNVERRWTKRKANNKNL